MGIKDKIYKMKLTKDQRHTAYILMLHWFEKHLSHTLFLCESVNVLFDWEFRQSSIKENLPELWRKKPRKPDGHCWFNCDKKGFEKRTNLLRKCINETA